VIGGKIEEALLWATSTGFGALQLLFDLINQK
jgi:hypothetical protein